ncbi:hypothetical protein FNF27_01997 [Cafeteria roenbergensis]|uniref:Major facilitator superfamily (MFS) profile domain-containing protein n=1 Tax=Cafeteria roenbergensis TaxID=33653 RepID=A0A5A8CVH5_CAFRO|nr:hypothetical protein FNF29_00377 [Cafeteria roenbergensis]KAA0170609.1 hypothetical protein FNF28_01371 [Cafeteria roenbergensis]KAA0176716.1 hypothetical protein FNF27_01997 [Cafeteria roenbergensis]|eukprot:KAA0157025.1 hypothetical protein FNF29_00377 [Cafeteria roenbergensis]
MLKRLQECLPRLSAGRMVVLFCYINLLNYMDRGIVSGGYQLLNKFIMDTLPGASADNVDAFRGFLTSAFIVSYALSSVAFGHLVHRFPPFKLMAVGLFVWCIAVVTCAVSPNYWVLLFGRALSGVGEASFQCVVPPFIDDNAGKKQRSTWLAFFFAMIPCGTAIGYGWSAIIGDNLGWQWSFGLEAPLMIPAALVTFFLPYHLHKVEVAEAAHEPVDEDEPILPRTDKPETEEGETLTLGQEFYQVLTSPIYLASSFGYAAYTFAVAGFAAFGPQFLHDLGLTEKESTGSLVFGGVIAVTGFIGTALGGLWLDRMQAGDDAQQRARLGISEAGDTLVSGMSVEADTPLSKAESAGVLGSMEIDGSRGQPLLVNGAPDGLVASRLSDAGDAGGAAVDEDSEEMSTRLRSLDVKLCAALKQISILTAAGLALTLIAPFVVPYGLVPFVAALAAGTMLLFAATAGTNIAIMASVPAKSRPFAIGLGTVITHAFGDVPSPPLIGFVSDALAPHVEHGMRSSWGLRITLLLIILWIGWAVLLWTGGWLLSRSRRSFNERHRMYEELGGSGEMVWRACGTSDPDPAEDESVLRRR